MPIILVTGANGHGKGQFAIREILRLQDENDKLEKQGKPRRQIYANIHGINQDGATPLKDVLPIPSEKIFFGKQDNPDDPPHQMVILFRLLARSLCTTNAKRSIGLNKKAVLCQMI
ncbi:Uncharacterised protein [Moraxella lacunata]|uniref:Uncharacterized protein n=1 Tax=Moraxella lacunata TaxID=477 RepID=A0A378T4C3_MORLA|nr:hypothetical protein [Moraxella lacunata]STZ55662.1 Uncharacterised protein [Moraxella lacunata]STZ55675.1 Uncharacterised protein [Moraxella lacunata]